VLQGTPQLRKHPVYPLIIMEKKKLVQFKGRIKQSQVARCPILNITRQSLDRSQSPRKTEGCRDT
jgi:hypothetical protein